MHFFLFFQTFTTVISLSAIATNGIVPGKLQISDSIKIPFEINNFPKCADMTVNCIAFYQALIITIAFNYFKSINWEKSLYNRNLKNYLLN